MSTWVELVQPISSVVSVIAIVGGGVFSFAKWLDVRRRELRQQRWTQYQQTIGLAWGSGPNDQGVPTALQIAAVYQLAEFKEFAFMTALSLEYVVVDNPVLIKQDWKEFVGPHVKRIISLLKQTRAYKNQSKQFGNL